MDSSFSPDEFPLQKIVSGGQTGVDRAALDAAIILELEHGGWCPRGRRAEDGRIAACYQLQETDAFDYAVRTEKNVVDSDATLILCRGNPTGGTRLTIRYARRHNRPLLVIDLNDDAKAAGAIEDLVRWIRDHRIRVLNVAGPRESSSPGIGRQVEQFLVDALG